MISNLEQAARDQLALWEHQEAGEDIPNIRTASLRPGYELRRVPWYGMGTYVVNVESGGVCEFDGVWMLDGSVLLCRNCFEDGT